MKKNRVTIKAPKPKRYSAAYFIEKFKKIPTKLWTTGDFTNEDTDNELVCHCVLGHLGATDDNTDGVDDLSQAPRAAQELAKLFKTKLSLNAWDVNDWELSETNADGNLRHPFKGKSPRTRVLAALRLIAKNEARS